MIKKGELFVGENSPTILTALGVTGTITTAVLTGRATVKAMELLHREDARIKNESEGRRDSGDLSLKEKAKIVWPVYLPPVGAGSVTITSIIMANRMSSKKAAALAAAYSISERAFQEYKDKIIEKIGENKERSARDEIAQDRVKANPINTREVIIAGTGEVLCFDMLSGRYFQSSVEDIKKAENKINYEILNHMYASLSQFYEEIGLPPTMFSDEVGFNLDYRISVQFSTTLSVDDRPCVAISFETGPVQNYARLYN